MDAGRHHINIFWSDADACYVADIPDFEYCSALGDSPEEALAELQTARRLWVEAMAAAGRPIPAPRYRPGDVHSAA